MTRSFKIWSIYASFMMGAVGFTGKVPVPLGILIIKPDLPYRPGCVVSTGRNAFTTSPGLQNLVSFLAPDIDFAYLCHNTCLQSSMSQFDQHRIAGPITKDIWNIAHLCQILSFYYILILDILRRKCGTAILRDEYQYYQ